MNLIFEYSNEVAEKMGIEVDHENEFYQAEKSIWFGKYFGGGELKGVKNGFFTDCHIVGENTLLHYEDQKIKSYEIW